MHQHHPVYKTGALLRRATSAEAKAVVKVGERYMGHSFVFWLNICQVLKLVVSPAILQEYEAVLPKAIRSEAAREEFWQAIELARAVEPEQNPPVTEDRSDDKFLAAAVKAGADAIVTNDEHLLAVHPYQGIEILRSAVFTNE